MSLDNLIDGRAIAKEVHAETEARVAALKADGVEPCLVFIRVGEDPASRVYVGMKERTAAKLGIRSETTVLPEDTPEAELLELCLLYTSPSPRDRQKSRMPSSA